MLGCGHNLNRTTLSCCLNEALWDLALRVTSTSSLQSAPSSSLSETLPHFTCWCAGFSQPEEWLLKPEMSLHFCNSSSLVTIQWVSWWPKIKSVFDSNEWDVFYNIKHFLKYFLGNPKLLPFTNKCCQQDGKRGNKGGEGHTEIHSLGRLTAPFRLSNS